MNNVLNFAVPPNSTVSARAKGKKILIVDDEPLVRRFIEQALRASGYEDLVFSGNGSNVPTLALKEQPQLIIMDVMMPGGNGIRALRALKESPATAGIPVILTSGFNFPTLGECSQNRPDAVLAKPFVASQLLAKVEGIFEKPAAPPIVPEVRRYANGGSRTQPVPV
ncbi:MAG TPA: response regulator [Verrucomicrobiales bacterium]|nr:response regulator [Verrucomicrobiales bacterium]